VLALCLAVPLPVPGAAATPDFDASCGSPLGTEAETGANLVLAHAADPEYDLIDTLRMPGAQRSPEVIVSAWGKLVLIAEVKVDQFSNFTWAIFARIHSNVTGWNVTPIWLSSVDTTQDYPVGVHVRPSAAVWNDRLWVIWDAQGSTLGGPTDRLMLLRSIGPDGVADATRVASATDPNRTNEHPVLIATPQAIEIAYSTSDGDVAAGDTHIVERSFNGTGFGPTQAVSNVSDSWADALPAIAADAQGNLYAAWTAVSQTGLSSRVLAAWRHDGLWSNATALAELGHSPSSPPAVAAFLDRVFIAYSTDYFPDLNGTDSEVRWVVFSPVTGTYAPAQTVNPEPSNGDDSGPTLAVVDGKLLVGWTTTEDFYYAAGSDPDAVYRPFDGTAFGPLVVLSDPAVNQSDASPHFVQVGGHLYAHWMMTPPQVSGAPRGDAREGIRLVERPRQWYDDFQVWYSFPTIAENATARILLDRARMGSFVPGDAQLKVRVPSSALYPVVNGSAWVPVNPSAPDFQVLACGKVIQATAGPTECQCAPPFPTGIVAAGIITFVAVLALWRWRRP
jgi:hypothetical protein